MRIFILSFITIGSLCLGNPASLAKEVSFNYDIRPIMSDTCFLCHGPDEGNREADLRFDIREIAIADRDGSAAIVPGDPEESLMIWMINQEDEEDRMPPKKHPRSLMEDEKELFRKYVERFYLCKHLRRINILRYESIKNSIDSIMVIFRKTLPPFLYFKRKISTFFC